MSELAHIGLYVRDLQRSLGLYRDVVGLAVVGTLLDGWAMMLSGGRTHHPRILS